MTMSFAAKRGLFGVAYAGLMPDYFDRMPRESGVFLAPVIPIANFSDSITKPGDVDLLIIPYEGPDLIVHRTLAIEVKAIRASFSKQGKSPNGFGFSQARGLQKIGFPFVAVAHLIVSDESPQEAWREMQAARVLDSDGHVELLGPLETDCMPFDLVERAFGRLSSACDDTRFGLIAAYLQPNGLMHTDRSIWYPETRAARLNSSASPALFERIVVFFERHSRWFLDNPRFDPPS